MPGTANQNNMPESTAANSMEQWKMEAVIKEFNPERGILATADVKVGDIMIIRNVKIKEDDYGLTVTMPRTKMSRTEQYKDSVFFADKGLKERFDQTVQKAYQDRILSPALNDDGPEEGMEPEQEEESGMNMEM